MPKISLIFPTTPNRLNPCCCIDTNKTTESFDISTQQTITGYQGSSNITLRSIEYTVTANIISEGDQLGGTVDFYHRRKRISYSNTLIKQQSQYPVIPIKHEWYGLKFGGFSDTGTLRLIDDGKPDTGRINSKIKCTLDTIALDKSSAVKARSTIELQMQEVDKYIWHIPDKITCTVALANGSTTTTIIIQLDSLSVYLLPGIVQIFGVVSTYTKPDSLSVGGPIVKKAGFTSSPSTSLYNTALIWSNDWLLIDNTTMSSIVRPATVLPFIPEDISHFSSMIKLYGQLQS